MKQGGGRPITRTTTSKAIAARARNVKAKMGMPRTGTSKTGAIRDAKGRGAAAGSPKRSG